MSVTIHENNDCGCCCCRTNNDEFQRIWEVAVWITNSPEQVVSSNLTRVEASNLKDILSKLLKIFSEFEGVIFQKMSTDKL